MYRTILVPLDGSKRAERILPHVENLAHHFDSTVAFLRVVETVFVYTGAYDFYGDVGLETVQREKLVEEARAYLEGLQSQFGAKTIMTRSLVLEGPVVRTIIDAAEREGAELIAMASHGRTALARVFYGSVAAGVLGQVDRPLLIIRAESE
jgi:nucleotide-binding universal stress UspA family protein